MSFYDEYFKLEMKDVTEYKISYLKSLVQNNTVYKFIAFDNNEKLNQLKLDALKRDSLWFSYYKFLNDKTEFEIDYSIKKVCNKTGHSQEWIKNKFRTLQQLYNICSFTYDYQLDMWNEYANHGNGFCLVFEIIEYDFLWPVEYKWKKDINWTKMIIKSIKTLEGTKGLHNDPMAYYPFVVKNPKNDKLDSTKEKELRMNYSPYDTKEFNNGFIYPNVKTILGHKGLNVNWNSQGLRLKEIIIGDNCKFNEELHDYGDVETTNSSC